MARRRLCALSICRSLFILFLFTSFISTASAILLPDFGGTVFIIGNDPSASNGSFKVQVDYGVYNGKSETDPLGITNDIQISFVLTNLLGGDGETPALTFGRFVVFAPDIWDTDAYYTSATNIGTTGRAPRLTKIHPPSTPTTPNCVEFWFNTSVSGGSLPQFAPGDVSKTLVVRTPACNLPPTTVLLEIDSTNSGLPAVSGDLYITIPEPCSLSIFGAAMLLALRRRIRK